MRIPEVRERLSLIAADLAMLGFTAQSREINKLVFELYRRPYVRKARDQSRAVTPAVRARLKAKALANPDLTYQDIAASEGVTAGRVSEAVAGKRT